MVEHGFIHHCPEFGKPGSCPMCPGRALRSYNNSSAPEKKLPAQTISPCSTQQGPWEQPHLSARAETNRTTGAPEGLGSC